MLERDAWHNRIPHAGRMALIERVLHFDADSIDAESDNHREPDHPLRSDGRLHGLHLCEYGAQVMAVHGALCARESGGAARPGYLVALRDVRLHVTRIDDLPGRLQVHVECLLALGDSLQYEFRVEHRGSVLASGRAAVLQRAE